MSDLNDKVNYLQRSLTPANYSVILVKNFKVGMAYN